MHCSCMWHAVEWQSRLQRREVLDGTHVVHFVHMAVRADRTDACGAKRRRYRSDRP